MISDAAFVMAIFGAIGSGKTSCCMHPFAQKILGYQASDADRPLDSWSKMKGDFRYNVPKILKKYGRKLDYFEISLDCLTVYNPQLNNLFGRGKKQFWRQAY